MGSNLWAVDMLLNDIFRPMINAYTFKDYETASHLLVQLNSFLCGYGAGIDDLPQPNNISVSYQDRRNPVSYYKLYYHTYSKDVLKKMGIYVREVLDEIKAKAQYAIVT